MGVKWQRLISTQLIKWRKPTLPLNIFYSNFLSPVKTGKGDIL